MRVAITGATGNVGTSLIERLGDDDTISEIIGVARRRPDWSPAKTRWVEADIAVDDLAAAFRDVEAVVHLAWTFHPTHNPLATWENNAMGSDRVFRAAAAAGVRTLVSASSIAAYSPAINESPVDESWPTHALPTAAYGREKSYVERLLDVFERDHTGIRVVRLRPGFIFKESSAEQQRRLFVGPLLPNRLVRPEAIPVIPDLPGLRFQTLHTRDAAQAYHLALTRDVSGAFNVAADPIVDVHALAELLGARVVRMPLRAARAAVSAAWHLHLLPASPHMLDLFLSAPVMDTTRAKTELGWTPTMDSLSAIREVMEGMREGAGGATPPLAPDAGGTMREKEIATGVGERGGVTGDGR